jgi:hypothetical protein
MLVLEIAAGVFIGLFVLMAVVGNIIGPRQD